MQARGRQSTASLSVISGGVIERIDPPESLSPAQADFFRGVIATKPSGWWTLDNVPLLVEYCRTVDMGERLAAMIEAAMGAEDSDMREIRSLMEMRHKEVTRGLALATKMRLTQQSSYNAQNADTAKRRAGGIRKPWQTPEI